MTPSSLGQAATPRSAVAHRDYGSGDVGCASAQCPPLAVVASDHHEMCEALRTLFERHRWSVVEVHSTADALDLIERRTPALVVVGAPFDSDEDGLDAVQKLRGSSVAGSIWLCTRRGTEELAIRALRAGVDDYLRYPIEELEFEERVSRVRMTQPPELGMGSSSNGMTDRLVGTGGRLTEVRRLIHRIGPSSCNVLIAGETGTGKELVAELLHRCSPRLSRPFVSVNCAAIPEHLFESELFGHERGAFTGALQRRDGAILAAQGGTLFLDEIGELNPLAQAKLLRVVECGEAQRLGGRPVPLDVRIIAATNRNVDARGTEPGFRSDLYFRLSVARIDLPPLREHREDILPLIGQTIDKLNLQVGVRVRGFERDALDTLIAYPWPGNVRELRNAVETAFHRRDGDLLRTVDLPSDIAAWHAQNGDNPNELERLLCTLEETNWNKSRAARRLQWSRMTLYRKIAKYRVSRESPELRPRTASR